MKSDNKVRQTLKGSTMRQSAHSCVLIRLGCLAILCMSAIGCSSNKINKANSEKIKPGMSIEAVEQLLGKKGRETPGKPDFMTGEPPGFTTFTWDDVDPPNTNNRIMVEFRNGKVDGLVTGNFSK